MADGLGIEVPEIPFEAQFYLQGFEEANTYQNKRWIRLTSLYPEKIDYVEFYRNDRFYDIAYEEPYYVNHRQTWIQQGVEMTDTERWRAVIHLHSGDILERENH